MPTPRIPHALYRGLIAARLPDWLAKASADDLERLHALSARAQASRQALEDAAKALPRYDAYATTALKHILVDAGETRAEPGTAVLHWVNPDTDDTPVTCTLVQAALRNFAEEDTRSDAFGPGSGLYRDAAAAAALDPSGRIALAPWAFARACREADLGTKYARALASSLPAKLSIGAEPGESPLPRCFAEADRDTFKVEACIARMKGAIDAIGQALLANWDLAATDGVAALPARASRLKIAGFELDRVLVILADHTGPTGRACLLYIPNDPTAPLKQFATLDALGVELQQRLGHPAYLRFMAGFVGLEHEQAFVLAVQGPPTDEFERLVELTTNPIQALEVAVRLIEHQAPFPRAAVHFSYSPLTDVFTQRYAAWAAQTLADAAVLAVPTSRVDRAAVQARHQRWIALGEQLGLLVLSFIPGVGQVIGVYSMVQLMHTVFEASRALERGDERLARALLLGSAQNAGTLLAGQAPAEALDTEAFASRLQLIARADHSSRLWLPDMEQLGGTEAPEAVGPLPADGILKAGGRAWVRLGDRYVPVASDVTPWQATLLTEQGYRGVMPRLLSNGHGGWRGEYEQPGDWAGATLVRRCGTEAHGLEDHAVSQIMRLADVHESDLRAGAVRGEPLPGLLRYLLARCSARVELGRAITALRGRQPLLTPHPAIVRSLASLPGWPADLGIELLQPDGQVSMLHPQALRSLRFTTGQLASGEWLSTLVQGLTITELGPIIGAWNGLDAARDGLAERLADVLQTQRATVLEHLAQPGSRSPAADTLSRQFPSLPVQMLEELLRTCDSRQLGQLEDGGVPLQLAELAVARQRELRLARACEALAEGEPSTDRDALLMGLAPELEGWPKDLALELSSQGPTGRILRAGAEQAPAQRIVIDADRRYSAVGARAASGTLEGIIVSLANQRGARWTAEGLRIALTERALTRRSMLRAMLGMAADNRRFFRPPTRSAGNRLGYRLSGRGAGARPRDVITELLLQLYPDADAVTLEMLRAEVGEGPAALEELARRQTELNDLRRELAAWLAATEDNSQPLAIEQTAREVAVGGLVGAWQRRNTSHQAQRGDNGARYTLSLRHLHVGLRLPTLTVTFPHVLELDLTDMNLEQIEPAFLERFPNTRVMSLNGNPLRVLPHGPHWLGRLREVYLRDMGLHCADDLLPWLEPSVATLQALDLSSNPGIANAVLLARVPRFTLLRELELDDNAIELTVQNQRVFSALTNLRSLSLDRNPLALPPSVEGLSRLQWLSLADTGIARLPPGLESLMNLIDLRLRYINLAGNHISRLPDLTMTTFFRTANLNDEGPTLNYFNLDGNPLDEAAVTQLDRAGLEYDPVGALHAPSPSPIAADRWLDGCPEPLRERIRQAREESSARAFYQVLSEVVRTAPYVRARTTAQREEVTQRAWALAERFLAPADASLPGITELRDRLYDMASEAQATCGDGVVLTLDQFEGEVSVWQAIANATSVTPDGPLREGLVPARRLFRQALVDAQAQRLVRAREARQHGRAAADPALDLGDDLPDHQLSMGIDEVELRLVLRQHLRQALDLPPVSERLYDALVSDATAGRIAQRVNELDTRDGFGQWLAQHQLTWRDALGRHHAGEFEQAREPYDDAVAYVLARAAGEMEAERLSSLALAVLEAAEPEVDWQDGREGWTPPELTEQQAYVLSNRLSERCRQAIDSLRLRLIHALLD